MKTYNFSATVNYPDDEADTPQFNGSMDVILGYVTKLLTDEPDATSFVIVISVNPEKKE